MFSAEIGPEDVGLKPDSARYFKEMKERGAQPTSAITTKTLYECDTFAVIKINASIDQS